MEKNIDRKIKILFFISSLEAGGAERVMVYLLRHINKKIFQPVLLLLYPPYALHYYKYVPEDVEIKIVQREKESFISKIKQLLHILYTIHKINPDVILSMLTHCNIIALLAKILLRKKVIISEHNNLGEIIKQPSDRYILGIPVSFMVKRLYNYADLIVTVSNGVKENLLNEFNVKPKKAKNIYNPIDLDFISSLKDIKPDHPFFKNNFPVIVSLGRLVNQKGFDILLRVFKKVLHLIDSRLIIIGDGNEREKLLKEAKDLKILNKVSFIGFQTNPFKYLFNSDLYVLSSRTEGMPVSLLEAMACGLPVVAFDCKSGPREILENGKYGVLVPEGDEEELANSIINIINNPELRQHLSELSEKRAKDFEIYKIVAEYEKEILNIC